MCHHLNVSKNDWKFQINYKQLKYLVLHIVWSNVHKLPNLSTLYQR